MRPGRKLSVILTQKVEIERAKGLNELEIARKLELRLVDVIKTFKNQDRINSAEDKKYRLASEEF